MPDSDAWLARLLDGEREKVRDLSLQNEALTELGLNLSKFVFYAQAQGWISEEELEVLLDLRDDPALQARLTDA